MPIIDPKLYVAADTGDLEFLRRAVASKIPLDEDYFLGHDQHWKSNIFNIAATSGHVEFVREALRILPTHLVLQLISGQQHIYGWNPLHDAANFGRTEILRLMLGFYKSFSGTPLVPNDVNHPRNKPWLALSNKTEENNTTKETPLHRCIVRDTQDCAMEILAMDMELFCNMPDEDGNSLLFLAVQKGFNRVAEKILNSNCSYSLSGKDGSTALHVASGCSESVAKLLLKKHRNCLDTNDRKGFSVLRRWAEEGSLARLVMLLDEEGFLADTKSKMFRDLIYLNDVGDIGKSPLHHAMMIPNIQFVQELVDYYLQKLRGETGSASLQIRYENGDTPLHVAMSLKLEDHALYFLSVDSKLSEVKNDRGESPLFAAVRNGCEKVVKEIMRIHPNPDYTMLRRNDGLTLLHLLQFCSEETGRRLLGKFWWMINMQDAGRRTALDEAKIANFPWLVNLLINPSLIQKEPFDWIKACEEEETWAIMAFIETCNDLEEACRKENDTPLHHIKLDSYQAYQNFLKIPSINKLKNTIDREAVTPLHRALKRKDKHLAMALLEDTEVWQNIVDDTDNIKSKMFQDLICSNDVGDNGKSPLHHAMMIPKIKFVQELIDYYMQNLKGETGSESLGCRRPPWEIRYENGDTPLHVALSLKLEDHALYFLSVDSKLCEVKNDRGESPLFAAVRNGCKQVVKEILRIYPNPKYTMLHRNDGLTLLHLLQFCSDSDEEETSRRLLGKFWWMINIRDDRGRTALDEAKIANLLWLEKLLINPSLIQKEPFDWIKASEEETWAIMAFIETCNDLEEVCRKENDTPLHHIKLDSYQAYRDFLKNPSIKKLKNTIDGEGATPLHQALRRKDIHLAKALLADIEVERNIMDDTGNTALSLLLDLCGDDDEWAKMCKQINVNPYLNTTYIQARTNLDQMRNTLSVVAALLATITFAAAFTLPGGLNSTTGYGMLAKKVPFLVFLLADAYAMCTSILVLFCLIWSMISDRDMSYFLVDRSVFILMHALYGTLLAFMTGVFAVIAHDSLWAAIIVLVLCSLIGISVHRKVLHQIISKLVPSYFQLRRKTICAWSCVDLEEGNRLI